MSEIDDLSYCELRSKEVVNSVDGRRMGRIIDLVFSCETGCIKGIVVPMVKRNIFCKSQDIFIPWKCVNKIGEDVILVNVVMDECGRMSCKKPPKPRERDCDDNDNEHDDCDCDCKNDCDCDHHKNCDSRKECDKKPKKEGNCCKPNNFPNCDRRCEKCMLFDCAYRWVNDS